MEAWDLSNDISTFVSGGSTTRKPGVKDGVNVIGFGDTAECNQPGASGVACLWFRASSGAGRHEIIETDIILSTNESWRQAGGVEAVAGEISGSAGLATASWFDVQEFLTHELGHAIGLEDIGNANGVDPWPETLSDTGRNLQTMYLYAFRGSTNKRTLELGDTMGLRYVHDTM